MFMPGRTFTEVEEVYEKGSVTIYPVTGKTKSETLNLEDI